MKRSIAALSLTLLGCLASPALADSERAPELIYDSTKEGIPVFPGVRPVNEDGEYQLLNASFDTVYREYREQLEQEGFFIRERERLPGRAVWEISGPSGDAVVTLDGQLPGLIKITVD